MKFSHRVLIGLVTIFLFSCGTQDEKSPIASVPQNTCYVPGTSLPEETAAPAEMKSRRFLVKLKPGIARGPVASVSRIAASLHGQAEAIAPDLYLVQGEIPESVAALRAGADENDYEYIEPDFEVRTTLATNDEFLPRQWAHPVVESEKAWQISRGGSVVVAVLDSGIDMRHPDLVGNLWTNPGERLNGIDDDQNGYVDDIHGWNFVSDTNDPTADDSSYHGTHVAGTIGAVGNNKIGISGHAQEVQLMALKFLSAAGSGYISHAIRGIDYAIAKGARIINNSWGSSSRSQALAEAISRAEAAGILFVAAAGNNGSNNNKTAFYPANFPQANVISVAATTSNDELAGFSNYGPTAVHLAAPGAEIFSTKNGNAYQVLSGTSMATPLVSGVLAMMVAARPDLSYSQIKGALLSSVDEISSLEERVLWKGRVNAFRALTTVRALPADWSPPSPPGHECH